MMAWLIGGKNGKIFNILILLLNPFSKKGSLMFNFPKINMGISYKMRILFLQLLLIKKKISHVYLL